MNNSWHTKSIPEVLNKVATSTNGLSSIEAANRLKIYGSNTLDTKKHTNAAIRFLNQFNNILIYVLLVSATITFFLNHPVDASVILGVVILNAIFGFIQEGKAEKAIERISHILAPNANVIRDNESIIIPAQSLVIGDIVSVKSGDKIPADLRLINVKNLQIQEAILTGESNPIEKNTELVTGDTVIGDRINMAYSGTAVVSGRGIGVVVATGMKTEIGKIGNILKNIQPLTTPLLQQFNAFARWITLAIIILAAITFLIGVLVWHDEAEQVFMAAVGIAVAAIPEGLPPILTIILAIGVTRMAKRNAIIRQLPAVETMGAITTICTDKTGTLTRNELTVKNIITADNSFSVEENSHVVFTDNKQKNITPSQHPELATTMQAILLCNDAEFTKNIHGHLHIHGNPIDKAFIELCNKSKIDLHLVQQEFPRTDLIPYESGHKFMATLHHTHDNRGYIYLKGAPEHVISKCSNNLINGIKERLNHEYWHNQIEYLAKRGYRVIAVAYKEAVADKHSLLFDDVAGDLTLIAMLGLIDAPRAESADAVNQCYSAGIKVKMITGDHAVTAATIASQVGIDNKSGVLTGNDIDQMSDIELIKAVNDIHVYARTTPEHKLRLVQALQNNNEIVAMTGDGVNDAPALRKANIGIAMGLKGAEVAKESSAMVLADDNFATIVHAIEEGRIVYDNLKKAILLIIPTNAAEAISVVIAILFGLVLPITPIQILWVNMVTAVTLAIALGFETAEDNVMQRPPRKPKTPILSLFLIWRIFFVSALLVGCVFGLFTWQRLEGIDLAEARTIAVNMIVMGEAIYLFNCRKINSPSWNLQTIFGSKPVLIAIIATILLQLVFTYLPTMQHFFGTTSISIKQWLYIMILSIMVFIMVEVEKLLFRSRTNHAIKIAI